MEKKKKFQPNSLQLCLRQLQEQVLKSNQEIFQSFSARNDFSSQKNLVKAKSFQHKKKNQDYSIADKKHQLSNNYLHIKSENSEKVCKNNQKVVENLPQKNKINSKFKQDFQKFLGNENNNRSPSIKINLKKQKKNLTKSLQQEDIYSQYLVPKKSQLQRRRNKSQQNLQDAVPQKQSIMGIQKQQFNKNPKQLQTRTRDIFNYIISLFDRVKKEDGEGISLGQIIYILMEMKQKLTLCPFGESNQPRKESLLEILKEVLITLKKKAVEHKTIQNHRQQRNGQFNLKKQSNFQNTLTSQSNLIKTLEQQNKMLQEKYKLVQRSLQQSQQLNHQQFMLIQFLQSKSFLNHSSVQKFLQQNQLNHLVQSNFHDIKLNHQSSFSHRDNNQHNFQKKKALNKDKIFKI